MVFFLLLGLIQTQESNNYYVHSDIQLVTPFRDGCSHLSTRHYRILQWQPLQVCCLEIIDSRIICRFYTTVLFGSTQSLKSTNFNYFEQLKLLRTLQRTKATNKAWGQALESRTHESQLCHTCWLLASLGTAGALFQAQYFLACSETIHGRGRFS